MTKKQLKRILSNYRNNIAREKILDALLETCVSTETVLSSKNEYPYSPTIQLVSGYDHNKASEVQRLFRQKRECMAEIKLAVKFIEEITVPLLRSMFEAYYLLKAKTGWKCIAFEFGWCNEQIPRVKHDRYLASLEKLGVLETVSCKGAVAQNEHIKNVA